MMSDCSPLLVLSLAAICSTGSAPSSAAILLQAMLDMRGLAEALSVKFTAAERSFIISMSRFNFPVAVWSWNTALAWVCGDSCLWKPSSKTPLCAIACQNIVNEVFKANGLPEGISWERAALIEPLSGAAYAVDRGGVKATDRVLISGGGTNLQAIIDAAENDLPVTIRAVISNEAEAYGLQRASRAGIETRILSHRDYPDRKSYDQALGDLIASFQPRLVALAGFMRILSPELVQRFQGRMLNIHPSLLPKYRGLHTHQRALDAGEHEHGASVHFVTEELDGGPLILQARVPVQQDDDADRLAARVLSREHIIYPTVIRWIAEGRVALNGGRVYKDGKPLHRPVMLDYMAEALA